MTEQADGVLFAVLQGGAATCLVHASDGETAIRIATGLLRSLAGGDTAPLKRPEFEPDLKVRAATDAEKRRFAEEATLWHGEAQLAALMIDEDDGIG